MFKNLSPMSPSSRSARGRKLLAASALAAAAALVGCDAGDSRDTWSLDQNQDGICDGDGDLMLPPPPDQQAPALPAPLTLSLDASLATTTVSPSNLRAALVHTYQASAIGSPVEHYEIFSTAVDWTLPARIQLSLSEAPKIVRGLQARLRNDYLSGDPSPPTADEIPLSAYVILYDDVNGDGRAGFGTEYFTTPFPEQDASDGDWDAYFAGLEAYHQRYSGVSFFRISSPSDAANEVIAAAPLSVWFGRDDTGLEGYRLFSETRECEEFSEGNTACASCWSTQFEESFSSRHGVTIDWQIEN